MTCIKHVIINKFFVNNKKIQIMFVFVKLVNPQTEVVLNARILRTTEIVYQQSSSVFTAKN